VKFPENEIPHGVKGVFTKTSLSPLKIPAMLLQIKRKAKMKVAKALNVEGSWIQKALAPVLSLYLYACGWFSKDAALRQKH
jgi:hypothetical protein